MGLIATGDADLALALADTVAQAYAGTDRFEGPAARDDPGAWRPSTQHGADRGAGRRGITSLEDLRGKRVSIGAPGWAEVNAAAILEANGITYDDTRRTAPELQRNRRRAVERRLSTRASGRSARRPPRSSTSPRPTASSSSSCRREELAAAQEADPTSRRDHAGRRLLHRCRRGYRGSGHSQRAGVSSEMSDDLAYEIHARDVRERRPICRPSTRRRTRTTVEFTMTATPGAAAPPGDPLLRGNRRRHPRRPASVKPMSGGGLSALLLLSSLSAAAAGELVATRAAAPRSRACPFPEGAGWCVLWRHSVEGFEVSDCYENRGGHMVLVRRGIFRFRRRARSHPRPRSAGCRTAGRLCHPRHRRAGAGRTPMCCAPAARRSTTGCRSATGGFSLCPCRARTGAGSP